MQKNIVKEISSVNYNFKQKTFQIITNRKIQTCHPNLKQVEQIFQPKIYKNQK